MTEYIYIASGLDGHYGTTEFPVTHVSNQPQFKYNHKQ